VQSKSGLVCAAAACVLAAAAYSSTARAQSAPKPKEKKTEKPRSGDGLHVGALGGVGFPHPLAVEGVVVFDRLVLLGAEYSALPTTTFEGVQTSLWAVAADARLFPFRNGFFVGVRGGQQHLEQSATITVTNVGTFSGSIGADTTFINPRMGFLFNLSVVALGIDAGVQIPLSASTASNLPPGISAPPAVTAVTQLSQQTLPTIDLLRIGLVF
jgi:hypothetical protein